MLIIKNSTRCTFFVRDLLDLDVNLTRSNLLADECENSICISFCVFAYTIVSLLFFHNFNGPWLMCRTWWYLQRNYNVLLSFEKKNGFAILRQKQWSNFLCFALSSVSSYHCLECFLFLTHGGFELLIQPAQSECYIRQTRYMIHKWNGVLWISCFYVSVLGHCYLMIMLIKWKENTYI